MLRFLTAMAAVLSLLLAGCGKTSQTPVQAEASVPADPNEIKLDENLAPRVRVGEVEWATVGASFSVAGRVEVDETRTARIGSPVMGRITSLSAVEGQEVKAGQMLATILSTGLSDAQLGFLKALSQKQVAQRAVDRAQVLLKADVIGSAELQRREAELAEAGATLDAARDQLLQLGMPAEAVEELRKTRTMNSVSRIVATMDGT
ncbi:MAG: efflux RND transporter periplasmic adaptor subunit, partial [Bryobacterales bacterium]|nr:efflux RND transporter periplasmic adaptor subunit [Bryobacterales bacterium]